MPERARKALCCCGSSFITLAAAPIIVGICHCDNCKRRTGSAFGWSAYFLDDAVLETGGALREYRLSERQQRSFCATCGTTLFWKTSTFPGHTGVAGGCFEDPLPEPNLTVSNDGKCAWVGLPESWRTSIAPGPKT